MTTHAIPKSGVRSSMTALIAVAGAAFVLGLAAPASAEMARVQETNLKPYTIVDGTIPKPLTSEPGDPVRGKKIFVHRKKGNCLACHSAPIPEEQFHGEVGPDLRGVASRLTEAEMRMRLVDARWLNPYTSMPSFYKTDGLTQVKKSFRGKPILTAQEIEDVIAYLKTLK